MNQRTSQILKAAIQEFIEAGEPVSSQGLFEHYRFGVKPATIRNELGFLTEKGYLAQPYTSGGRIPTNRGYQFFVTELIAEFERNSQERFRREITQLRRELFEEDFSDFVFDVGQLFGAVSVGYRLSQRRVYKSGLDALFQHIVPSDIDDTFEGMKQIVKDFEVLDKRMIDFVSQVVETPQVFIGKNSLTRSHDLSVVAGRYEINGEEFVVALIVPKRMDYEKGIQFFKAFANFDA